MPSTLTNATLGAMQMASFTITEKGYALTNVKGEMLPVVLAVLFFIAPEISIHDRILPGFISLYAVPFIAISSLFWFCKNLPHIPVITYIGRYSLIVLGTHSIILGPIRSVVFKIIGESYGSYWAVLGVVIVAELIIIPVMIKLFPKFTAQEELIKARS